MKTTQEKRCKCTKWWEGRERKKGKEEEEKKDDGRGTRRTRNERKNKEKRRGRRRVRLNKATRSMNLPLYISAAFNIPERMI